MNTDKLINSLCDDLKAVKPMPSPWMRTQPFMLLIVVYLGVVVFITGIRSDLFTAKLHDTTYIFEFILSLSIAFSSLFASIWMSVPDMRGQKWISAIPLTLTAIFVLWIACRMAEEGLPPHAFSWHDCFGKGILFAAIPVAVLVATSQKGATTHPVMTSFMNILCASAMGFIALRITCPNDHIEHALYHHIAPFITMGGITGVLTRRLYRW